MGEWVDGYMGKNGRRNINSVTIFPSRSIRITILISETSVSIELSLRPFKYKNSFTLRTAVFFL